MTATNHDPKFCVLCLSGGHIVEAKPVTGPLSADKLVEIQARAASLLTTTLTGAPKTVGTVLAEDIPALLAEIERLKQEEAFHWGIRMEVEKVLDEALGPNEEDGAGGGLVADVALLADRKTTAEAEVGRLQRELSEANEALADTETRLGAAALDQKAVKRICDWIAGDPVTGRSEFGDGYREALRDIAGLINGREVAQ